MPSHPGKPLAGSPLPSFVVNHLDGTTQTLVTPSPRWTLLVIYRGKHCGRCKKYLNALESMKDAWDAAGFNIMAVSADSIDKARQDVKEFGWTFPVAAQLAESDMRNLGLYISDPLTPDEADARFAEPAVFCLRPDTSVQIAAISNGPSARPDLAELLDGMIFTINNGKPARGTVD
jgi:peroxiredoxin